MNRTVLKDEMIDDNTDDFNSKTTSRCKRIMAQKGPSLIWQPIILAMLAINMHRCGSFVQGFTSSTIYTNRKVITHEPFRRQIFLLPGNVKASARLFSTIASEENKEDMRSLVNDFTPATMSLTQSMVFAFTYLFRRRDEQAFKEQLMGKKQKWGILSKLWSKKVKEEDFDRKTRKRLIAEVKQETEEKQSLKETLKSLDKSRKELSLLVGFDGKLLTTCFGFAMLAAFMNSVIPHYYGQAVNCLANAMTSSKQDLLKAITGLGAASVLCALFTGIRGALFWLAGARSNYNVRVKLHRNLLLQEAGFFDSTETGILLSRLNNDVNKIGMVISFHVNIVFRQFAQLIFGAIYLLRMSRPLASLAFTGIFLVAIVSAVYGEFSKVLAERLQDMFAGASAIAETSFSMSETVRAFDGVQSETDKYELSQLKALELEEVQAWAYGSHKFISDSLQTALQGLLLFACWTMGRAQEMPVAKLTTFMFYVNFVLESSNEVGDQWAKIQSAIGASSNVFELIRRVPSIRDPSALALSIREPIKQAKALEINGINRTAITDAPRTEKLPIISISDMTVKYDALDDPALETVNLDIFEGDRVAIVGRSGSGKSTLLRAVLRFYDPVSGSCHLEGTDLTKLTRKELVSRITVVQQEPHLFPMSLMDNVLYGIEKDEFDDELGDYTYSKKWRSAVAEVLAVAGLPIDGSAKNCMGLELDTRVGEGGRTLSGGQRQRVAIARALIRKPGVLLLDEPTAALDSESEKVVVEALSNAMKQTKSMIMVTHRLGVIRSLDVNKVVVLERGRIHEMGNPEDLLHQGGIYAELAKEQSIVPLKKNI
mmetsp:Transcript_11037/g.16078  ORF Transcript_11037/g.16078 Transcript_11037/m.16078 type:complete len:827 (+) Transcript_11037:156-2636(+)|eukprot:CAMPEP_0194085062 /NCGR_PEP_ID=MMETSP0149-20130528/16203_1 /TAXON_ID=122233 /ORGANISM="Chaetoceros debilis, Strain MM31A-1" /LENGTH=826 /DNA_ID=CAMNT_0038767865 /DNA_START=152 /DNA_END=2632 /DNA_ORIENTATION=-